MNTIYKLPETGKTVTLHTHFVVREDEQSLYGFYDLQERILFRALIKINGVGPKLALTILSSIEPQLFNQCVSNHDIGALTKIPGVGKKTAERLVVEMADRLPNLLTINTSEITSMPQTDSTHQDTTMQDAISALLALGYKLQQASHAITAIYQPEHNTAELIRQALRRITE